MKMHDYVAECQIRDPGYGITLCNSCLCGSDDVWMAQVNGEPAALCRRCRQDTDEAEVRRRLEAADAARDMLRKVAGVRTV